MSETVKANDGTMLPINDIATQLTLNGNNDVVALTVTYQGSTFVQTITRNGGGYVTNISEWIKQP